MAPCIFLFPCSIAELELNVKTVAYGSLAFAVEAFLKMLSLNDTHPFELSLQKTFLLDIYFQPRALVILSTTGNAELRM